MYAIRSYYALIVDVRTKGEFMSGAFPNAINIPLDDIMQNKFDLGSNPAREIVVYCASGASYNFV